MKYAISIIIVIFIGITPIGLKAQGIDSLHINRYMQGLQGLDSLSITQPPAVMNPSDCPHIRVHPYNKRYFNKEPHTMLLPPYTKKPCGPHAMMLPLATGKGKAIFINGSKPDAAYLLVHKIQTPNLSGSARYYQRIADIQNREGQESKK